MTSERIKVIKRVTYRTFQISKVEFDHKSFIRRKLGIIESKAALFATQ